jgi:predicted membrane channel-forming protein YqfA (hemolysin III family)
MGIAYGIGLLGGAMSPFVKSAAESMGVQPFIILGAFSLVFSVPALFLHETKDLPLLDQI